MRIRLLLPALLSVALLSGVMSCHKDDDDNSSNNSVVGNQTISGVYVCTGTGSSDENFMQGIIEFSGDNAKYKISYYDGNGEKVTKENESAVEFLQNGQCGVLKSSKDTLEFVFDERGFVMIGKSSSTLPVFKKASYFYKSNIAYADYNPDKTITFDGPYGAEAGPKTNYGLHKVYYEGSNGVNDDLFKNFFDMGNTQLFAKVSQGLTIQMEEIEKALTLFDEEYKSGIERIESLVFFDSYNKVRQELQSLVDQYYDLLMSPSEDQLQIWLDRFAEFHDEKHGNQLFIDLVDEILEGDYGKRLYQEYDCIVYNTFVWEAEGYFYREAFRIHDLLLLRKAYSLCMMYWVSDACGNVSDEDRIANQKTLEDKFNAYWEYFNETKVKRDNRNAVCQIPGCHFSIEKELKVLKFNYGYIDFEPSSFDQSFIHNGNLIHSDTWKPGHTAIDITYGHEIGVPKYYFDWILLFYRQSPNEDDHKKSLIDILTKDAGCIMPDGDPNSMYIVPAYQDYWISKDDTRYIWLTKDEMTLNAYDYKNDFPKIKVGVPKIVTEEEPFGIWPFSLWLKDSKDFFDGWKEFNHDNIWVFPILINEQPYVY